MWWLLLLPISLAGPIEQNLSVGQILNVTLTPRTTVENPMENGLPEWMYVSNGRLVGIPTAKDIGPLTLKMKSPSNAERLLKIRVTEDESNPCGTHDTTWVEVVYNMPNGKIQDRVQAALKMAETLKVGIDTVRVLDFDYSRTYRAVENIAPVHDGSFAVIKPHCDDESEAIDLATDDMDKLLDEEEEGDNLVEVTVTQGRVLTRKQRGQDEDVLPGIDFQTNEPEPITKPPVKTTTQRTTRQSPDNPPVRLNSLSGFSCVAGVLCESHVPEQTFKDAEEGDTYKLQLSVTLLDEGDNFLFYKDQKLQGVPLKAGEYQFRLDARDQRGQMASAPFSVSVKPASAHNHLITFHMDLAKNSDIEANPEMLTDFVRQLTQITKTKADSVTIRDITKEGDKTIVSWSNNSLPYKTCSEKGIETMMAQMLTKKRNMTNRQFVVAMTSRFNLRKVEYTLLENCIKEADLGTTMPTVEAASEGSIPWIPILVAALVVVLLVICCLVMCSKKNTKKGTKPSEYVGKGLPVVFPEEVADEMELTNAATPMLTKEERPPLKVSSTHENPLYKPPPPLVASSPRVGSASGSLPPTQRMPPPYVPP